MSFRRGLKINLIHLGLGKQIDFLLFLLFFQSNNKLFYKIKTVL